MYIENDPYIELIINTWISEIGELFDFNTTKQFQKDCFKSTVFPLLIPKHKKSEHYYFIHQRGFRGENSQFKIQRRTKNRGEDPPISRMQFNEDRNLYKLLGGFKIFYKETKNKKLKLHMKIIDINQITQLTTQKCQELRGQNNINRHLPFIVVRSFPKGYQLKKDQKLKIGKLSYQVNELFISCNDNPFDYNQNDILNLDQHRSNSDTQQEQGNQSNQSSQGCRFCPAAAQLNNPLINPCACKGTSKYIHLDCLKSWLDVKLTKSRNKKEGNLFHDQQLFCEICKKKFPKVIIKDKQTYELLTFVQKLTPFIALKAIIPEDQQNVEQNKMMYLTFLDITKAEIGRLQSNQMILYENSVSRKHAAIELNLSQQKYMIIDKKSKYGTLIYEKGAEIKLNKNMRAFQLGNSIFGLKIIGNPTDPV